MFVCGVGDDQQYHNAPQELYYACLLYTSDAADE